LNFSTNGLPSSFAGQLKANELRSLGATRGWHIPAHTLTTEAELAKELDTAPKRTGRCSLLSPYRAQVSSLGPPAVDNTAPFTVHRALVPSHGFIGSHSANALCIVHKKVG